MFGSQSSAGIAVCKYGWQVAERRVVPDVDNRQGKSPGTTRALSRDTSHNSVIRRRRCPSPGQCVIDSLIDDQMPIVSLPSVVVDTGVTIPRLINPHLNGHTLLCCHHCL